MSRDHGAPSDLVIADAEPVDAGEILTLQRAAFLRDAQITGDPFLPSLVQTLDEIVAEMTPPAWIFLKATIDARIVGSVRGHVSNRAIHIGRLMTAPDLQGRGIGGVLLAAIEARAAPFVDDFELATGAQNESNIAMYTRRGYLEVRRVADSPTVMAVVMRKHAR